MTGNFTCEAPMTSEGLPDYTPRIVSGDCPCEKCRGLIRNTISVCSNPLDPNAKPEPRNRRERRAAAAQAGRGR